MKKNIINKILLGVLSVIITTNLIKLLVPGMYFILTNLLGISINLLSGVVITSGIIGLLITLGLTTKCIETKKEYIYSNEINQNPDLMRKQLSVVKTEDKSITKQTTNNNKYSYLFDNNYTDVEDIEIDDVTNPNWRTEQNCNTDEYDDSDIKIYTRKK